MGEEADQLRDQIEARRERMGGTVDAIEDRVTPGRVIERQQARVGQRWQSLRERVMGSSEPEYYSTAASYSYDEQSGSDQSAADQAKQKANALADSAQSTAQDLKAGASDALSTAKDAPQIARQKTEGNPLAAGAIAFGLGALFGSLSPASQIEKDAVARIEPQIKDTADQLRERATDVASNVQSEAQGKVEDLKSSAQESADAVKGEAQSAAQDVKSTAKSEAQDVKDDAQAEKDRMTS